MGGLGGPRAQGEEDERQVQEMFTENPLVAEHVGYGQGTNPCPQGACSLLGADGKIRGMGPGEGGGEVNQG